MADPRASITPSAMSKIEDVLPAMRPTKLLKAPQSSTPISYTSLDFDAPGEFLLLSRTDDTIQLFNAKAGAHAKELKSQKYGSALARFTHHSTSILYASTKVDHGIRYLSMHDNTFIRYFRGHTGRVTSLQLSPSNDRFLSASLDNTVRLWDLRSPNPSGQLDFESPYLTAFDPSGTVIAIASPPAQTLLLYDLKNYDKPPFCTFDLLPIEEPFARKFGQSPGEGWTNVEFSNNGKFILLTTNGPGHYLLDAYSGELKFYLHRASGSTGLQAPDSSASDTVSYAQADAVFAPDGRYVISGCAPSTGLLVWDCMGDEAAVGADKVLEPISELPCTKPASVVAHNPRHNMLASADREVVMWLPDLEAL